MTRQLACWLALFFVGLLGATTALAAAQRLMVSASSVPSTRLAQLLTGAALLLGGCALVALALGGAAGLLGRGRATGAAARLSRRLAPTWWRRSVLAAAGVGLAAVPQVAIAAELPAQDSGGGCPPSCRVSFDGLPMPDLPETGTVTRHRVLPGDSLWAIAIASLPRNADVADVARLVHRIHQANRTVIGDDPDLIFPGTHLTVPGGTR